MRALLLAALGERFRFVMLVALVACAPDAPRRSDGSAATPPAEERRERESSPERTDAGTAGDTTELLAVLRDYYAAIDAGDYGRAYADWGDHGPPGHPTRAAFAAGFARTDSVRLAIGAPGRVEGAAGSRYADVPVTIHAYERGGRERVFTGTYTLRRTVVPGASATSRRWHLERATLHETRSPP
jgi:hypothetical protein